MSVRQKSVKLGLAAVATAGLALTVLAPANADTVPNGGSVHGSYTLGTTLIGVGSDTIQWVDDQLSTDYDNQGSAPAVAWANFDACLGNTSSGAPGLGDNPDGSGFPCGADHSGTQAGVKREEHVVDSSVPTGQNHFLPSGSGDGRTLLRSPSDPLFMDVAYARSSGPISAADSAAGLLAFPFAVDKIVVTTHPGGPAPASLTGQQILKIYNGTYTNWNQVGGKKAPIHPYLPKSGSSTLNAFESFLASLDDVTEAPGVDNDAASHAAASQTWQGPAGTITNANWNKGAANVEEHDPSVVSADADALEPFSYGRAQLANKTATSVRIEGGWSEDRELYHVVRDQKIPGVGDPAGDGTPFLYGADGGALEALFNPQTGWVCNNATARTDIANAGFWPLATGTSVGNCGVSTNQQFDSIDPFRSKGENEGEATKTSAFISGGAVHISVDALAPGTTTPTGSVQLVASPPATPGHASPASFHTTVKLSGGKATVKLPGSVSGHQTFDVAYLPTDFGAKAAHGGHTAAGSSYIEFDGKVKGKVGTSVKASAAPGTLKNAKGKSKVTITVKAAKGSAKATGKVSLLLGKKKVGTGTLKNGKVTITVKGSSLKKGKNKLVVAYTPKGGFSAPKKAPSVTITRKK
ncbi:MAG TPA: substrate-binding domain-containing protein [Solirubrobacterales bacterium]|nr:substrate-binding domain-containing protein [Solirubrobacterales bacterium]